MKLLAASGLVICVAFTMVGTALKGGNAAAVTLGAGILGLFLSARLLAPTSLATSVSRSGMEERRFLAKVVLWAFLARALVAFILQFTGWWWNIGPDEATFDSNGQVFYMYLRGDLPFSLGSKLSVRDEFAYPYLVGGIYYAFGISKVIPLLLNCAIGASIVYPVHALAGRLGGRQAAHRAALLVAFFPSLILWSSLMVRDIWALFLLASVLYFADRMRRRISMGALTGLLACAGALAFVRSYIFFVVIAAVSMALLLGRRSLPKALFTGGLVMVAVILALRSGAVQDDLIENTDLSTIAQIRYYNSLGSTGVGSLGTADISTPTKAITYLPLGLLYFYCSPLPWQVGSPRQAFALVDLLLWYSCLPAILFGMLWLLRRRFRAVLPIFFTVIGISVLYALVEGNIGIIFRHRAQIIVPLCAVAGVGYALKQRAKRKESRARESAFPLDPAPRGPFRPPEDLRLPARAP